MTAELPGSLLLSGIVGSTAYGLATEGSDIDRLGVYAVPTAELHGLGTPRESVVSTKPDRTLHEARKWCRLALGCNPTAMELAWLPDELYEVRTELGDDLIRIRAGFLSAGRVRDAYLGYAKQQFTRLDNRGDGSFSSDTRRRVAKHARHLARLLDQGRELYERGHLRVRLDDPEAYLEFGRRVAAGDLDQARARLIDTEAAFGRIRTPLPDRPDERAAERWLSAVRTAHYEPPQDSGVWIVDLDGTTALRDETRTDTRGPFDWKRVGEDHPNEPVIALVRALARTGHRIIYMSGRSEVCRAATSAWIAAHIGVPGEALHMRPAEDCRPDEILKQELYERFVAPRFTVTGVIDDRAKVVRMWRRLGLVCVQVAEGDF